MSPLSSTSSSRWARRLRTAVLVLVAALPQAPKRWLYRRLFGYRIGRGATVGFSLIDVEEFELGDGATVGHGNLFLETRSVHIGSGATVGHLNVFRGGEEIRLGDGCEVLRLNVINSIVDPCVSNPTDPRFSLGTRATLTEGHKVDFTDRVTIGDGTIVAGRHSSFWTHLRQQTVPITIGDSCYIGSEVRVAPGVSIPDRCVVGIGSVVVDEFRATDMLIAGVPAKAVKAVDESKAPLLRIVADTGRT